MKIKLIVFSYLLFPILIFAEFSYYHKGLFDLGTIHRLSNGSIIKIPYRMITYESNITFGNLNLNTSSALEFRLKNNIQESTFSLDLREYYIEYMLPIGDLSLGKQIITWGSASENNPTDNISPYNYYYLFSIGKERKEGILSINTNIYWNSIKFNAIFIPKHNKNILPLNDPEFAISSPIVPTDEQIMNLYKPYEYGLSIYFPLKYIDLSTSYFSGYDRIVSFFGANVWTEPNQNPQSIIAIDTVLSYRKTEVYGIGLSYFLGDFTIRSDIGYFNTKDNINRNDTALYRLYVPDELINFCNNKNKSIENDPFSSATPFPDCNLFPTFNNTELINNNAKYYQYTIEVEYSPTNDLNIISQLTKYKLENIGLSDSIKTSDTTVVFDPLTYFIPGMGTPNTFISNNAFSISLIKSFYKFANFDFRYTNLFDLDKKGILFEAAIEYKIYKNTKLLLAINKIFSNDKIKPNPFSEMANFSHFRMQLKYYY